MLSQVLVVFLVLIPVCRGDKINWQARVVTGKMDSAGSNAGVFIQITGTEGKTAEINLDNSEDNFRQKGIDVFLFKAADVGAPTEVRVWHDNKSNDPGWHLTKIDLDILEGSNSGNYVFNCDCWIEWNAHYHSLERTLPLATMNWRLKFKTSNIADAGTNSFVFVTIVGDKGQSREIPLDNVGDDFARGSTDYYAISTVDIGTPKKISIKAGHGDQWHMDNAVLEDLDGAETYTFNCDCWIGAVGHTLQDVLVE